jgi:hypothetical protein
VGAQGLHCRKYNVVVYHMFYILYDISLEEESKDTEDGGVVKGDSSSAKCHFKSRGLLNFEQLGKRVAADKGPARNGWAPHRPHGPHGPALPDNEELPYPSERRDSLSSVGRRYEYASGA